LSTIKGGRQNECDLGGDLKTIYKSFNLHAWAHRKSKKGSLRCLIKKKRKEDEGKGGVVLDFCMHTEGAGNPQRKTGIKILCKERETKNCKGKGEGGGYHNGPETNFIFNQTNKPREKTNRPYSRKTGGVRGR